MTRTEANISRRTVQTYAQGREKDCRGNSD